jgi:hypothetical protein
MIKSENAGSVLIGAGRIVAAGGTPDTLLTLPPGKQHVILGGIPVPPGKVGTLGLSYGPGTVPHKASVRFVDLPHSHARRVTVSVTGPGVYRIASRVTRVLSIDTTEDPKGPLDVVLWWRCVLAQPGDLNLLGVTADEAKPGEAALIKDMAFGKVPTQPDPYEYGSPVGPGINGTARLLNPSDPGEQVGTFFGFEGDEKNPIAVFFLKPTRR